MSDNFKDDAIDDLQVRISDLDLKCHVHANQGIYDSTTFEWPAQDLPALPANPEQAIPPWHPSDPLITDRQRALAWFHQEFGIIGLWYWIYRIAIEEKESEMEGNGKSNACWDTIINDYDRGFESRVLYYLSAMHPQLIEGLIHGDLPRRMQDPDLKRTLEPYVTLRSVQGVYILYMAMVRQPLRYDQPYDPNAEDHVGLNLTLAQLVKVTDIMRQYCAQAVDNDLRRAANVALCKTVDSQFHAAGCNDHDYNIGESRYVARGKYQQILDWTDILENLVLADARQRLKVNPADPFCHIPLRRTFPYVGLAITPASRAAQHHSHSGTESPLYGLLTAITKMLFKRQFDVVEFTYQIIRTVRQEDIGLTENLGTILSSSYIWNTGLCTSHAGKQVGGKAGKRKGQGLPPTYYDDLKTNAQEIRNSGILKANIANSVKKIDEWAGFVPKMQQMRGQRSQFLDAVKANKDTSEQLLQQINNVKLDHQMAMLEEALEDYKLSK